MHCYSDPLLAILLNPIHANIDNPRLFEVEVERKNLTDNGLKEGWTRMRLIKELDIPEVSRIQKVAFGILCALKVYQNEKFVEWANNWLSGKDRNIDSAYNVLNIINNNIDEHIPFSIFYFRNKSAVHAVYSAIFCGYSSANASAFAIKASCHEDINLIDIAKKAIEIEQKLLEGEYVLE